MLDGAEPQHSDGMTDSEAHPEPERIYAVTFFRRGTEGVPVQLVARNVPAGSSVPLSLLGNFAADSRRKSAGSTWCLRRSSKNALRFLPLARAA